jgi:hypothetical protein
MDAKQINLWKTALASEIRKVSDKIDSLNADLQKKRQQLDLLDKLLISTESADNVLSVVPPEPRSSTNLNPTPDQVKDHVYEILREVGRPMNIKEIHSEFVRRGLPIAGKGTPFNILIHMSREVKKGQGSRFYRTGRGTYAVRRGGDRGASKQP